MTALAESAILHVVNTSTTKTNAAPATSGALKPSDYNRARAICSCRHHAFPCAVCEALRPTHTPEPWKHSADLPHHGCRLIHAADGYLVADAGRITRRTGDEMDSNARRIVSCVNACEGMADPATEIASLRAVESALRALINAPVAPTSEHHPLVIAAREALAGKGDK